MKRLAFAASVLSLFLTTPVFAISYSASVALDLTTLTFSGIPFSLSLAIPRDPFDPTSGLVEVEQRNTVLRDASTNHTVLEHNIFSHTHLVGPTTDTAPSGSTVTVLGSPTELSNSITLVQSGIANSLIAHNALLTAGETGAFTVSVDYTLSHSPILANDPFFSTHGRAGLTVGYFGDPNQARDFRDLHLTSVADAPLEQTGRLSTTYFFQAGQSTLFEMFSANSVTVPGPDTLWLMGLGFVGLAGWWKWRRMRAA